MAVIQWLMALALLTQGSLCSLNKDPTVSVGCKKWHAKGDDVCCEECHPGNRRVKECGARSEDLCTPCEDGTFTLELNKWNCIRCTQCFGVQVQLKGCTASSDAVCGCKKGYVCGDERCTFCATECDKGHEPNNRGCRPCPDGTYNDKTHQKCKSWSTKCPSPDQTMVAKGNATSDIQCVSQLPAVHPKKPDNPDQALPIYLPLITGMVVMASVFIFIIVALKLKINQKEKKPEKPDLKTPIIRPPTDDPRTLIAVECSFNEAQQEQGSSTESLISKQPAGQLIV